MTKIQLIIEDQNQNEIGKLELNGKINDWATESGNIYITEWGKNNDKVTLRLDGDFMANQWIDELDDEEDLMCLDWHEYDEKDPYFVDKEEIEQIFKNAHDCGDTPRANKLTENRYEVTFNSDLLYFVCPLNAREEVKEWWKELKWLFKEYE